MDAGIEKDLVLGDPNAPRFVYWDKKLRPTPSGPDVLTFDLMSIVGKIRAGLGVIGLKAPMPGEEVGGEEWGIRSGRAAGFCAGTGLHGLGVGRGRMWGSGTMQQSGQAAEPTSPLGRV